MYTCIYEYNSQKTGENLGSNTSKVEDSPNRNCLLGLNSALKYNLSFETLSKL